ncbi:unnamed protein product [Ixodes pacificus]
MSSGSGGSGGSGDALQLGPPEKDYYATERAFIFVCICIAISYQSFAEFPYLIIKHGGVCFFIPYTIVLFLLGIPMAYLEMLLGQFRGRGCLEIWSCVPIGKGLGMAMLLKTFVICAYKVFQDSIAFYYFLQIFQQELPWSHCYTWWGANPLNCVERNISTTASDLREHLRFCHEELERLYQAAKENPPPASHNDTWVNVCGNWMKVPFLTYINGTSDAHGVLKVTRSIDEFGGLRYEILVCYIFSWFVVYLVCAQGAATVGRVCAALFTR